jgi:hypothetical protein
MATDALIAEPIEIAGPTRSDNDSTSPASVTLVPSRTKWLVMVIGGAGLAGAILLFAGGDRAAMLIADFFAIGAGFGAIMLRPGAASLRLDGNGFEITHIFRTRSFSWSEVSDFGVIGLGQGGQAVAFKTSKPRLNSWKRLNAVLAGGRDECLPDTYGMEAENLAQLMNDRRHSATDSIG